MAPVLRQVYDQMVEPKWVISMGVCASSGGMFNNYAIVQGVDQVVPVDVYVPGCPPGPETLMHGILTLHDQIQSGEIFKRRAESASGGAGDPDRPARRRPVAGLRRTSTRCPTTTPKLVKKITKSSPRSPSDDVAAAVVERFPDTVFHRVARSAGRVRRPRRRGTTSPRSCATSSSSRSASTSPRVDHLVDVERASARRRRRRALRGGRQLPLAPAQPPHPRDLRGSRPTTPTIASLVDLYPGVNFAEREVVRPLRHRRSPAIPTSPASSCPTTGSATRCARTTRRRGCRSRSRAIRARDERRQDAVDERSSDAMSVDRDDPRSDGSRRRPTRARSSCVR